MLQGEVGGQWLLGRVPAKNPTSQSQLALRLMRQTPASALYLNRPCYGYKPMPTRCDAKWWTAARYSKEVVNALSQAIDRGMTQLGYTRLVLVGHSGGGTLAMLLAEKRQYAQQDVVGVITLAGNLNHEAWTQHHKYEPLVDSLNPISQPLRDSPIFRWHLAGSKDRNIPLVMTKDAVEQDPSAKLHIYPADHNCCWVDVWNTFYPEVRQYILDAAPL